MIRQSVAILVLGMWLGFLGVEVLEHAGLFEFTSEQTDRAVDKAVAGFGSALVDESEADARVPSPAAAPLAADLHPTHAYVGVARRFSHRRAAFAEGDIPLFLRQRTLIL